MEQISETAQEQLKSIGVQALYLFGSHAQGVAGPLSDYDFGVLMRERGQGRDMDAYGRLYSLLLPLCPRTLQNDVIDIVFLDEAPLELRMHVVKHGGILFESDARARAAFEARTMIAYSDYRPILELFDRTILRTYDATA